MKTTVLIVSILLSTLFSNRLIAQAKNELKISHGYSGINHFSHFDIRFFPDPDDDYFREIQVYGTTSLAYKRRVTNKISIGGQVDYSYHTEKSDPNLPKEHNHFVVPYVTFDYRYINKPKFELYSGAMISPLFIEVAGLSHITALGFRYGEKHAVFGELGFGLSNIISGGYSVKF